MVDVDVDDVDASIASTLTEGLHVGASRQGVATSGRDTLSCEVRLVPRYPCLRPVAGVASRGGGTAGMFLLAAVLRAMALGDQGGTLGCRAWAKRSVGHSRIHDR